MTGKCWCCDTEDVELMEGGICKACERGLEKQKETGRCFICGNLVDECSCDDYDLLE